MEHKIMIRTQRQPLSLFILILTLLLTSPLIHAYDAEWNGGREDITGPGPQPEPDCEKGECLCKNGASSSPVYTARGYLVWDDTDIQFPAATRVGLRRTYNSFDYRAGLFGRGWMTAQEVSIALTYKAVTEGNADGSPKTADEFKSVPIWSASYGRRYKLEETETSCTTPNVLYFTFEKLPNGGFKQVYEDNGDYSIYSATGALLESYSERNGTTVYYEYDGDNLLTRQYDSNGFELNFIYNEQGFVSQVTDQADRTWEYSYNQYGNLQQVVDPDGHSKDYAYQTEDNIGYKQHLLTDIHTNGTDPLLNVTWSEVLLYNKKAMRVSSYAENDGKRHHYSYAQASHNGKAAVRTVKTTKLNGTNTTIESRTLISEADRYWIVSDSNTTTNTSISSSYDANGKLTERTDKRSNTTRYEYNSAGSTTKITELAGTPDELVITRSYHNNTDRIAIENEYGLRETRYTYDSDLRVLTKTQVDLATGAERSWSYTYHPNTADSQGNTVLGKIASVDGPLPSTQDTMRITYNAQGLPTRIDLPLGQSISYSYNSAGQPVSRMDANGVLTEMVLSSSNYLIQSTTNGRQRSYAYNGQGQLTQITDELGRVITMSYDNYNRPVQVTYPSGGSINYSYIDTASYTEVTRSYQKADGTVTSTQISRTDPRSRMPLQEYLSSTSQQVNERQYNGLDDLTQIIHYGQYGTSTTVYSYDSEGRVSQIQDGESGITGMSYDVFARLTGVTDPNNGATQYLYTAFGDLTQQDSPDTGTISFSYDSAGNLTQQTNANNVRFSYSYDALNRVSGIDYAGDELDVNITYDEGQNGKGRLTGVTDGSGSSSYQYSDRGFVTQSNSAVMGVQLNVWYSYNDAGQITRITYPSGDQIGVIYDSFGRLSSVERTDNGSTTELLSNIAWHGSALSSYQQGNGVTTTLDYDTAGRLTAKQYGNNTNRMQNQLDNQGHITQQNWIRNSTHNSYIFQYDRLGRIAQDGIGDWDFGYDAVGNRLTEKHSDGSSSKSYIYDNNSNRLSKINSDNITLDAAGNTLSDASRQYQYNAMNRLQSVTNTQTGDQGSYRYNYKGQRVYKHITGSLNTEIRYVYGQYGELLGEYDSNGNRIKEYIYHRANGKNELIVQIEADGSVIQIHTDHVGTPRLATDQSKQVVWRWDSDAFGTTAANDDPDQDGTSTVINHRFKGQYFDEETGLHYNYFRYYDPSAGRYVSSDPIGLRGGVNTFSYVSNSPLIHVDPYGLFCQFEPWGRKEKDYTGKTRPKWGDTTEETLILSCWPGTPGSPCVFWKTIYTKTGVLEREYRIRQYGKFVCYLFNRCTMKLEKTSEIDSQRDSDPMWEDTDEKIERKWDSEGHTEGYPWGPDDLPNPSDGVFPPPPPPVRNPPTSPSGGGCWPCH